MIKTTMKILSNRHKNHLHPDCLPVCGEQCRLFCTHAGGASTRIGSPTLHSLFCGNLGNGQEHPLPVREALPFGTKCCYKNQQPPPQQNTTKTEKRKRQSSRLWGSTNIPMAVSFPNDTTTTRSPNPTITFHPKSPHHPRIDGPPNRWSACPNTLHHHRKRRNNHRHPHHPRAVSTTDSLHHLKPPPGNWLWWKRHQEEQEPFPNPPPWSFLDRLCWCTTPTPHPPHPFRNGIDANGQHPTIKMMLYHQPLATNACHSQGRHHPDHLHTYHA